MKALTLLMAVSFAAAPSIQGYGAVPPGPELLHDGGVVVPPDIQSGGQAVLAIAVDETGAVTSMVPLLATPPFGKLLEDAVGSWQFAPSGSPADALAGVTLVIGVFRSPSMYEQGPSKLPEPAGGGPTDVPLPQTLVMPSFPPNARSGGVVVLELQVGTDGRVASTRPIGDDSPLTEAASAAAAKWRFRPAERGGHPVAGRVYGVFGFPEPVLSGPTP